MHQTLVQVLLGWHVVVACQLGMFGAVVPASCRLQRKWSQGWGATDGVQLPEDRGQLELGSIAGVSIDGHVEAVSTGLCWCASGAAQAIMSVVAVS